MSCDVAMSAAILLAALHPHPAPRPPLVLAALADAPAAGAPATLNPLAREPLYAGIVARAGALKAQVQRYQAVGPAVALPGFDGFKTGLGELSAMDMQGHLDLAKRGTDGDLKCILRGISQDLPRKLGELEGAHDALARKTALSDLFYLLRDNVEVITSPPAPTV